MGFITPERYASHILRILAELAEQSKGVIILPGDRDRVEVDGRSLHWRTILRYTTKLRELYAEMGRGQPPVRMFRREVSGRRKYVIEVNVDRARSEAARLAVEAAKVTSIPGRVVMSSMPEVGYGRPSVREILDVAGDPGRLRSVAERFATGGRLSPSEAVVALVLFSSYLRSPGHPLSGLDVVQYVGDTIGEQVLRGKLRVLRESTSD